MDHTLDQDLQNQYGCGREVHSEPLQVYIQVQEVCKQVLQVYNRVQEDHNDSEEVVAEEDRIHPSPGCRWGLLLASQMGRDSLQVWQ